MYKGKIVKITDEEAFVMVKEYEFVRIKRRAGMIVGDEIEFSTEDIIVYDEGIQDSQLKNSSKSSRVERFTRISGMEDKESLKGDKIEGFTRISAMGDKESLKGDKIKGFTRVSGMGGDKEQSKDDKIKGFTRISNRKKIIKNFTRIAGVAAAFIMIFAFVEFFYTGEGKQKGLGEFAYVDVDINPSITFTLDENGAVNEVTLLNDNDDFAIEDMELDGIYFANALEMVVGKLKDERDFGEKMAVFISAALNAENNAANEEKIINQLLDAKDSLATFGENISVKGIIVDKSIREKALEHNVSMGRYAVYLEVNKQFDMPLDLIAEKTVHELFEIIDKQEIDLESKIIIDTSSVPAPSPISTLVITSTPVPDVVPMPTSVSTPAPEPTTISSPEVIPTPTPTPASTTIPISAPTLTSTSTPTLTPVPTVTPTPSPTLVTTLTPTLVPIQTPTPVPTVTPTPSPTLVPTPTPTPTPKPSPTSTPIQTPTPVPTVTSTPTLVPSPTPTPVPTSTPTQVQKPTPEPVTGSVLEDWENGENGWKAPNPHTSDAWASSGNKSLASPNISLSGDGGMIHMYRRDYTGLNISQKSKLQVDVYISDRGSFGGEVQAVLYIVTDKEYSTGKTTIQPGSKHTLILNLNGIPDLYDVSEIGVKFYYPSGSIGQTDFYIDYLRF